MAQEISIADELQDALAHLTATYSGDIGEAFEDRGITDHDGLSRFSAQYGASIAQVIHAENRLRQDQLAEHLAAAILGGFLIGIDFEQRREGMDAPNQIRGGRKDSLGRRVRGRLLRKPLA